MAWQFLKLYSVKTAHQIGPKKRKYNSDKRYALFIYLIKFYFWEKILDDQMIFFIIIVIQFFRTFNAVLY